MAHRPSPRDHCRGPERAAWQQYFAEVRRGDRRLIGLTCVCLALMLAQSSAHRATPLAAHGPTPMARVTAPLGSRSTVASTAGPGAQATAQDARWAARSATAANRIDEGRRSPAVAAPAATILSERDELRLAQARRTIDPISETDLLRPDEALAELRMRQAAGLAAPQASPVPSLTPDTQTAPTRPAPLPLPALPLGLALPGMPEYLVVGRTYSIGCATPARDIPTQRVRFVDYLRNVLPNEWVAGWPPAALNAGAIAVKQFAWYTAVIERKWRSQGYPFDVVDNTCDQYYRDASADPRTDAAIQRTWGTLLTRGGVLLRLYYRDTEASCGGVRDCMGQVESAVLASAGQSTLQILARYYNTPGTAVISTGTHLPAQLPPVPPAPPILWRPAPGATPAATPSSGDVLLTPSPAPLQATDAVATPGPDKEPPTQAPVVPVPTDTPPAVASPPERTGVPAVEASASPTGAPPGVPVPSTARPSAVAPTVTLLPPTPSPLPPTAVPAALMPNLVGLGENQAKQVLARLGITSVTVDYQGRDRLGDLYDTFPPYAVVSHIPAAGVPATPGMPVTLGVRAP